MTHQYIFQSDPFQPRRHQNVRVTAPAPKPGHTWNWSKRREEILARPDNVRTWSVPHGYVEAYGVTALLQLSRDMEVEYLASTQDRELAPTWAEMRENGIDARSIDESIDSDDDSCEMLADEDTEESCVHADDISGIQYVREDRRERWWREEDEYRWRCGNIRAARIVARNDALDIVAYNNGGMSKEQAKAWVQDITRRLVQENLVPTLEQAEAYSEEWALRKEFYGVDWKYSLLTPEEWDALQQRIEDIKWLNELETVDPYRDEYQAEDALVTYQQARVKEGFSNSYAGRGLLGEYFGEQVAADLMFWDATKGWTEKPELPRPFPDDVPNDTPWGEGIGEDPSEKVSLPSKPPTREEYADKLHANIVKGHKTNSDGLPDDLPF